MRELVSYQMVLVAGVVLAVVVSLSRARAWGQSSLQVVDAITSSAVGGVLVGRLVYVLVNWSYFTNRLTEAFQVWRGGLGAAGVLVGAALGLLFICRKRDIDLGVMLDVLAPAAAIVAASVWLGCLEAGCAWGIETRPDQGLFWHLSGELPDLYGLRVPRLAVQLFGAAWESLLLVVVLLLGQRGRPFATWLVLHSAGGLGLGFLRGDLIPGWLGLSSNQVADLVFLVVGLTLMSVPRLRGRSSAGRPDRSE